MGLQTQVLNASSGSDIQCLRVLARERPSAARRPQLLLHRSARNWLSWRRHRLPATYSVREIAEAGGLMSYGANVRDAYRESASMPAASRGEACGPAGHCRRQKFDWSSTPRPQNTRHRRAADIARACRRVISDEASRVRIYSAVATAYDACCARAAPSVPVISSEQPVAERVRRRCYRVPPRSARNRLHRGAQPRRRLPLGRGPLRPAASARHRDRRSFGDAHLCRGRPALCVRRQGGNVNHPDRLFRGDRSHRNRPRAQPQSRQQHHRHGAVQRLAHRKAFAAHEGVGAGDQCFCLFAQPVDPVVGARGQGSARSCAGARR